MILKQKLREYIAIRKRLAKRAAKLIEELKAVKNILGPDWSSIPGTADLDLTLRTEPRRKPTGRRGRPTSSKTRKLKELLRDGPKTKRQLAGLMNTTLADLDRVIYSPTFHRKGKMFSIADPE